MSEQNNNCDEVMFKNSSFHNPQLELNDRARQEKIRQFLSQFVLTKAQVNRLKQVFKEEMDSGLSSGPSESGSSLLMANTFVTKLPTGTEKGHFLSIDLGSTNFRILLSKLHGGESEDEFLVKYYDIPADYKVSTATILFDHIASCIQDFIGPYPELQRERLPLGFTFSFPMIQKALNRAELITWTKCYDIPEVVGQDVTAILERSLKRKNLLNVEIVAILNDVTGTQVKGGYLSKDCAIALILGTGFNACYTEKANNVLNWTDRSSYRDVQEVIIDIEAGAFGDNGCTDFIKTEVDRELDAESLFPGTFTFEKLISGNFLGDVVRRTLLKLAAQGLFLVGSSEDTLTRIKSITSSSVSHIEADDWAELSETRKVLEQLLGNSSTSFEQDDCAVLRYVCALMSQRAAILVAVLIAHLLERTNKPYVTVAIDGSLYKYHPKLKGLLIDFVSALVTPDHKFDLILAEDGSGKGAGLVAAVADEISAQRIC